MRYIAKHKAEMQSGQFAVWDTLLDKWYIWSSSPAVATSDYYTVDGWCKNLNRSK